MEKRGIDDNVQEDRLMTINRALQPTRDAEKIYLSRQKGSRGRLNMKMCVRSMENNVKNATEKILIALRSKVRLKWSGGI